MNQSELLNTIQSIADEGKLPSVALIKSRASARTPLPSIIAALNHWKKITQNGAVPLVTKTPAAKTPAQLEQVNLADLQQELAEMKRAIQALEKEVKELKAKSQ